MTDERELPRRARGERPCFFDDPAIDRLYAVVLAAAAELSVAYDRIDSLERLLAAKGLLAPGELGAFQPDEAAEQERAARRKSFIERLFRAVGSDADLMASAAEMPVYTRTVEELKGS